MMMTAGSGKFELSYLSFPNRIDLDPALSEVAYLGTDVMIAKV